MAGMKSPNCKAPLGRESDETVADKPVCRAETSLPLTGYNIQVVKSSPVSPAKIYRLGRRSHSGGVRGDYEGKGEEPRQYTVYLVGSESI